MRYGISRSPSPSERPSMERARVSFGLNLYDSSDDDSVLGEVLSSESEDSDEDEDKRFQLMQKKDEEIISRLKQSQKKEKLSAFEYAGHYEDPFSKWAKNTRTAAFRAATKQYESNPASTNSMERLQAELHQKRVKESHDKQLSEVTAILHNMSIRRETQNTKLVSDYQERQRALWHRIDVVIQAEEEKVRRRMEEEERVRKEEEEKKRREEERKKAEEEKKKQEELEKALKAELERKRKEKEEKEEKERAEREAQEKEAAAKLKDARKQLGHRTAKTDWESARRYLELVKRNALPTLKAQEETRSQLSKARRFITPKIGQLTNTPEDIHRIAVTISQYLCPSPPHPERLYFGFLSVLAKAILMQAETEVSARQVTALPLARVCIRFLIDLPNFSNVFYARMVQRTGGWAIPITVLKPEGMSEMEYKKLRGYRTEREEQKDFEMRVTGIMTLYFAIMVGDVDAPVPSPFALPDFWIYLSRLMSSPSLLRSDVATQIFAVAIEVGGKKAKLAWGKQFIKLLALLYKSIQGTETFKPATPDSINEKQIGAEGVEGRPGRVRVSLAIEELMSGT